MKKLFCLLLTYCTLSCTQSINDELVVPLSLSKNASSRVLPTPKTIVVDYGTLISRRTDHYLYISPYNSDLFRDYPDVKAIYRLENGELFGWTQIPPEGKNYIKFYKVINPVIKEPVPIDPVPMSEVSAFQERKIASKSNSIKIFEIVGSPTVSSSSLLVYPIYRLADEPPQPIGIGHIIECVWDYFTGK